MGADNFEPYDYDEVDFPVTDGIDPNWEAELAKAIEEDGVPDDDE